MGLSLKSWPDWVEAMVLKQQLDFEPVTQSKNNKTWIYFTCHIDSNVDKADLRTWFNHVLSFLRCWQLLCSPSSPVPVIPFDLLLLPTDTSRPFKAWMMDVHRRRFYVTKANNLLLSLSRSGVYFQGTTIGMAPIMSMCTAEQSGGIVMVSQTFPGACNQASSQWTSKK